MLDVKVGGAMLLSKHVLPHAQTKQQT
jgi:hypothetical protein